MPAGYPLQIYEWVIIPPCPNTLGQGGIFLGKRLPLFYNALLLTAVNLLLRFASTSFQVFLSGRIGAEGIGLLQLVLSVGALAVTAGMGGIRTATMYLSAEAVGQKKEDQMVWVLSGCVLYSLILSTTIGLTLYYFAPKIAAVWLGNPETFRAIRLFACFLPVNCLCGVMVGHFTGINRIGTLAAVEVAEQAFSMILTVLLLKLWAGNNSIRACHSVILGSGLGACFTLTVLLILKHSHSTHSKKRIKTGRKLWQTAVPLGIADNIKAGISTTENLMVPKRLGLFPGETAPLAVFGMVCGMVFPVLMFPAAILFGLAELLIPELARCNAAGSTTRIRHLAKRSMLLAMIYGCFCGGILFIGAETLCDRLYKTIEAGTYLRCFAVLAPMLYCDAITDAMVKGLGQQKTSVRYNILTSAMDVVLLFFLLPRYGIKGYYLSFLVTHLINFILSIHLLEKLIGRVTNFHTAVFTVIAAIIGIFISSQLPGKWQIIGFCSVFTVLIQLLGVLKKEDIIWFKGLITKESLK